MGTVKVKPLFADIANGTYDKQKMDLNGVKTPVGVVYSTATKTASPQVFLLSDEVAMAAQSLTANLPSIIPTDLEELRLPYPEIVVELNLTPELKALRTAQSVGAPGNPSGEMTKQIARVGMYVHSAEGAATTIQLYWQYEGTGLVEVPPVVMAIGAKPGWGRPISLHYHKFPGLEVKLTVAPSPVWLQGLPEEVLDRLLDTYKNEDLFVSMVQESVDELPTLLFAALTLINCKSGVSATRVPARVPPSGCGQRMRRAYSCPAFTVLSLSEVETVSPSGVATRRAELSAHYVRGHFKARKSGVYWWNSFIRGSGTPRRRDAYRVTA
jgi:hypothetical protein